MYISNLIKMDKKELSKVSKDELVKTLSEQKWEWESKENKIKELEARLSQQSENERAVKMMLIGYLGKDVERDEYSGSVVLNKVNLSELVGEVMVKAARY